MRRPTDDTIVVCQSASSRCNRSKIFAHTSVKERLSWCCHALENEWRCESLHEKTLLFLLLLPLLLLEIVVSFVSLNFLPCRTQTKRNDDDARQPNRIKYEFGLKLSAHSTKVVYVRFFSYFTIFYPFSFVSRTWISFGVT